MQSCILQRIFPLYVNGRESRFSSIDYLLLLCYSSVALTYDDESGSLEELLIVPGRMFCLQDVTDPVMLPQPYGRVHGETRQHAKNLLTDGQTLLLRELFRIQHVHRGIR